jgi:hypothetical protein
MNRYFKLKPFLLAAIVTFIFTFASIQCKPANNSGNDVSKTDSIDINVGYELGHHIKRRVALRPGDCLYILKDIVVESEPDHMGEERREDSFYCPLNTDTLLGRYTCDLPTIARIWEQIDSIDENMHALIVRDDTILILHYLWKQDFERPRNLLPLSKITAGLNKTDVREYRFKDREEARAAFRRLAFGPDVVMREDSDWLHTDGGSFSLENSKAWKDAENYAKEIGKKYPQEVFEIYYSEMQGRVLINSTKAFYDRLKGYHKSEFKRPKRFSFMVYRKLG